MFVMSIYYSHIFHFSNEVFIIFSVIIKQDINEHMIRICVCQKIENQKQSLNAD